MQECRAVLLPLLVCLVHCLVLVSSFSGTELASLKSDLFHEYDQMVRPSYNITPVKVGVEMFILDISELDMVEKEFKVDMFLRQFWNDTRLEWGLDEYQVDKLVLGMEEEVMMWRPDTFFVQEKERVETITSFMRLSHTGAVLWSSRLRITFRCSFDLRKFPFDHQICPVVMESFSMPDKDILYTWHKEEQSVVMNYNNTLSEFTMGEIRTNGLESEKGSGLYSSMFVDLIFLRKPGSSSNVFLLSSLLVLMSWIGFFLKAKLTTERILLFLIPSAVLVIIILWVRSSFLLGAPYLSSIEHYLIFCVIMVFLTSVQFIIVHILHSINSKSSTETTVNHVYLDHLSKVLFPIVFVIFQIVFWSSN